jgi:hypothetical protein
LAVEGVRVKTTVIFVLLGALAGIAVASLLVPPALSWYSAPGGLPKGAQVQAIVQIPEVIRYSTSKLIWGQTIGAAIGAVIGLALGIVVSRSGRARAAAVPATTPRPGS